MTTPDLKTRLSDPFDPPPQASVEKAADKLRAAYVHAALKRVRARAKKLDLARAAIRKKHSEALTPLSGLSDRNLECLTTGMQGIDDLISGDGDEGLAVPWSGRGIPRGRLIEIFGPPAGGKTTFILQCLAAAQALGKKCALVDAEHSLDHVYARKLGVQLEDLEFSQPYSAEEALDIAIDLLQGNAIDLLAIDSVAAMVPEVELEGDVGDTHVATQARLMSQTLKRMVGDARRANCTILFVNQLRSKVGRIFGNPEITSGGSALKFYASVRLDVRKTAFLEKSGGRRYGIVSKLDVIKNKAASPFRKVWVEILNSRGIVKVHTVDPKIARARARGEDVEGEEER